MKRWGLIFTLALAAWLPHEAFGWKAYFSVTASGGSPIPIAFSSSDSQSHVLTGLSQIRELCVYNDTATRVVIDIFDGAATPTIDTHKIAAYSYVCVTAEAKTFGSIMSADLYIRGESAISAGGEVFGFAN